MLHYEPTICPYCSCGCGLYLVIKDGKIIGQEPWKEHPVNEGSNCPKGMNAYQFLYAEDRLTTPLIRKNGELKESTWDEVLDLIATTLGNTKSEDFGMLASGKNTNEDAYVLQKFTRLIMGTNNIEYCGRLCHSPSAAGLSSTVGSGVMPISELDIDKADCIFLAGINPKETFPMITRRILRAKKKGAKVIVLDPRKSVTAKDLADLHLQHKSGTDIAVLNAMMKTILEEGLEDKEFISSRTKGIDDLKSYLSSLHFTELEKISGVSVQEMQQAAQWIAEANTCSLVFNQGLNQHSSGSENVKAISTLALLTGQYGRAGAGACPTRGQINGEGTGDMGCLNVFYPGFKKVGTGAHEIFEELWGVADLPSEPGLPYTKLLQETKFLWVVGTNPVMAAPDANTVKKALQEKDLFIVQDIFLNETAELADVVLPAATWVERQGVHAYIDRRVQKINKIVEPPGEAKPDWWIVCQIAERMGYGNNFDFSSSEEIFEEIRQCVPSYSGITYARLDDTIGGIQWPCPSEEHTGTPTFFTEKFNTPDGLGHLQTVGCTSPAETPDDDYPYTLTTGRSIFHYHTGTMSRRTPKLDNEVPKCFCQINPKDANVEGIEDEDLVVLSTRRGSIDAVAHLTEEVPKGMLFVPIHFGESNANELTNPVLDPACGMPEYKVSAARIEGEK
ncbi:MAG: formate dehydrogenase subunit alpha [Candidatus Thorarchaeota archaeon]